MRKKRSHVPSDEELATPYRLCVAVFKVRLHVHLKPRLCAMLTYTIKMQLTDSVFLEVRQKRTVKMQDKIAHVKESLLKNHQKDKYHHLLIGAIYH